MILDSIFAVSTHGEGVKFKKMKLRFMERLIMSPWKRIGQH